MNYAGKDLAGTLGCLHLVLTVSYSWKMKPESLVFVFTPGIIKVHIIPVLAAL